MNRLTTGILLTLSVSGLSAVSLAHNTLDKHDQNNDGKISKDEFYGTVSDAGIFGNWDKDRDGLVDKYEYELMGIDDEFEKLDQNSDSYLDSAEAYDGVHEHFDSDKDGAWSRGELQKVSDAEWIDI